MNRVNPSHLRPEPFLVGGKDRGLHYVERFRGVEGYVVTVDLVASLPHLVIRPRGIARHDDTRDVAQRIFPAVLDPVDLLLIAHSPGDGFPAALFRSERAAALLRENAGLLDVLEIAPLGTVSRLVCRTVGDPRFCIELVEELVATADVLATRGTIFPDAALARIGVRSDEDPSPEAVERLAAHLTDSTHWLAGHTARVGDAVESHVTLDESGDELAGVLRIAWRDPEATVVDASLDGALPRLECGPLVLAPQKGPWARIRALTELHVGDREIDSAYLIDGDPRQLALVRAGAKMLGALAPHEPRVELDADSLRVRVPPRLRNFNDVHQLAETLLLLWRSAAIVRAGHPVVETPEILDADDPS